MEGGGRNAKKNPAPVAAVAAAAAVAVLSRTNCYLLPRAPRQCVTTRQNLHALHNSQDPKQKKKMENVHLWKGEKNNNLRSPLEHIFFPAHTANKSVIWLL